MSDPHTIDLRRLSFAGQLLVWSARKWVTRDGGWRQVEIEFDAPFGTDAGRDLAAALDALYALMNISAVRPMVFGPTSCGRMWRDEGLIVRAVELEQAQRSAWAITLLERVLPAAAARQAIGHIARIGFLLEKAGYMVAIDASDTDMSHTPAMAETNPAAPDKITIH